MAVLALDAGTRLPAIVLAAGLLVAGANGATLPLFALAPACADEDARETAAGLATTIGLGGTVIGTQVGALVIDASGYPAAFLLYAALSLTAALLALPLGRALRARPLAI